MSVVIFFSITEIVPLLLRKGDNMIFIWLETPIDSSIDCSCRSRWRILQELQRQDFREKMYKNVLSFSKKKSLQIAETSLGGRSEAAAPLAYAPAIGSAVQMFAIFYIPPETVPIYDPDTIEISDFRETDFLAQRLYCLQSITTEVYIHCNRVVKSRSVRSIDPLSGEYKMNQKTSTVKAYTLYLQFHSLFNTSLFVLGRQLITFHFLGFHLSPSLFLQCETREENSRKKIANPCLRKVMKQKAVDVTGNCLCIHCMHKICCGRCEVNDSCFFFVLFLGKSLNESMFELQEDRIPMSKYEPSS